MGKNNKINLLNWKNGKPLSKRTKVILVIVCIAVLITGVAAAKYVNEERQNQLVSAEHFYFTSDILDGKTHKVSPSDDGSATVELNIMNQADALRFSDVDIEYSVSVAPSDGITVNNGTGTLAKNKSSHNKVTISGLEAGKTYTVTATTINQTVYKKSISGTIVVGTLDKTLYASMEDEGSYINVTVWAKDNSDSIEITYPAGLIPDNTNSLMADWSRAAEGGTITKSGIELGTSSSLSFRFFKTSDSDFYSVTSDSVANAVTISKY